MKDETEEGEEQTVITDQEWTTVVKHDVKKTLKSVPVIKAQASNGTAKLHFKSKEDMKRAQEALKTKYTVTSKTQENKKLDPKLTISDLHSGITNAGELENLILEKNDYIRELKDDGETLKMVFLDKDKKFAVIQVSPKIREAIRGEDDKICLDLQQHHVRDRFHVIQCYHCQGYGHTSRSNYCKQKDSAPTCFYCAGSHTSKTCKKKETGTGSVKCANCAKSNNRVEKMKCSTHKASDNLCPFYVREKLKIMARTPGCEESKNMYHQRVKDHQRRLGRL